MKPQQFGQTDYERDELCARYNCYFSMIGIGLCWIVVGIIDKL